MLEIYVEGLQIEKTGVGNMFIHPTKESVKIGNSPST